jgi:hypothetical protein
MHREIPAADGEAVTENNTQRSDGEPGRRKRRLLVIEGAPGFEHTFVRRARAADPGLEVDSVVRKGRDVNGSDTFLIQAEGSRAAADRRLPARREDLYSYDAVIVSNVEGAAFTRDRWTMLAEFVSERGGGFLRDRRPLVRAAGTGGHASKRSAGGARRAPRRELAAFAGDVEPVTASS